MHDEHRSERRKKTVHRIHRLQGQLNALERTIEDDSGCEDILTQARAIEKGVTSLMTHVVGGYLRHQFSDQYQHDPDQALEDLERIIDLLKR